VTLEAALEPARAPLGAERSIVPDPPLALVCEAPIERCLTELLELETFTLLTGRCLRPDGLAVLALVPSADLGAFALELLGVLTRPVVVAHGTPLLRAVPHQTRGAVLRLGAPAKQQAFGHATLGVGFQALARRELVTTRRDPPRERDTASVGSRREQSSDRARSHGNQQDSAQPECRAARWCGPRTGGHQR
jgi:hypothetical protein